MEFYDALTRNNLEEHRKYFHENLSICTENKQKDVIATIFYMTNCLQEHNVSKESLDAYGRFKYLSSYQAKFGNGDQNLVQHEIDHACVKWKIPVSQKKSRFFISHDIDTIYGSLLQDGYWALKKMKIGVILNLIAWEFSKRPHWKNIDRIIKIDSEHDIQSTFFWLVNKNNGFKNIKNADYDIKTEHGLLDMVNQANFFNGLHKSVSDMSINEEIKKGCFNTTYNRYHFLKFLPQNDWISISNSTVNFDCSLGFAEHCGFRNSYGKAFQPFDFRNNKPFDFIEAPLHFMDTTFHKYMNVPRNQVARSIIRFYEKNPTNCDFSILWHNNYFSNYKYHSFLEEYKKMIGYIYENKIECVSPGDLIKENKISW